MNLLRTTMIGGLCLSSLHIFWVLLVATGWAQPLMDLIFKLHMLSPPFKVQPFDFGLAAGLIALTFFIGCFYGAVFYLIRSKIAGD